MDKSKFQIIIDRKEAIECAINKAEKGDIIVLLSKGGDKYQRIKNIDVPYESDITIARNILNIKVEKKQNIRLKNRSRKIKSQNEEIKV